MRPAEIQKRYNKAVLAYEVWTSGNNTVEPNDLHNDLERLDSRSHTRKYLEELRDEGLVEKVDEGTYRLDREGGKEVWEGEWSDIYYGLENIGQEYTDY